ncbi:MAG: hypothetical protein E7288_08225 [Lachnospiraceae bacterium]|nr:hypothetical protein [Lachnospiraceae bacterium]
MDKREKNQKITEYICAGLMIGIPLLIALVVALVGFVKTGLFPEPGLKWNDEAAYLQMIKNCITTGQPVGYWGFNGNHALVGTGGAWSPAIIWPYAVFAFVFPITGGFVYYVNLFYITLANLIFWICVRPSKANSLKIALTQATSAVFILYLSVNMSEIFRYAFAIVIAGLLYHMFFHEAKPIVKYVVTPLVIIASVQIYVFFAFCVPIYVFALLRKSKLWVRLVVSVPAMGIVALGSYYLLHLISSNYNIYKTEALLAAVKAMDIPGAVVAFLRMMKAGMGQVFQLWTYVYSNPLIPWHVLFSILLVVIACIPLVRMFIGKKKEENAHDGILGAIVVYSIPLFYLMYMTLYSIEPFTFVRGTQIAVVFSLWLLALMKDKILFVIVLVLQAVSLIFLPANMDYFMQERYMTEAQKNEWEALEEDFAKVLVLEESDDPWDNTVYLYTMEPKAILAIPGGFGVNFIMQDGIFPEDAAYVLCSKTAPDGLNPEWLEKSYADIEAQFGERLELNYAMIYESEDYIIFRKNRE